jgi:hypothetical protein
MTRTVKFCPLSVNGKMIIKLTSLQSQEKYENDGGTFDHKAKENVLARKF